MKKPILLLAVFVTFLWSISASSHEGTNAEIASLGTKIQKDPQNAALHVERAALYRRARQFSAALADLAIAQKIAPRRLDIQLEKGLTLADAGRNEEAETLLSAYLAAGLPSVKAFEARGKIRENAKRFAEARSDYAAAVQLDANPETFLARGRMDEALGHWDDAARGYEEGLRKLSGAIVLRLALVRAENHQGHYDRAISLIDEILPNLPLKMDWLLLRADLHAAAGRPEKARQDREEALHEAENRLSKRPTDLARMAYAKALHVLGRREEAWREIELVVRHAPKLDEARKLHEEIRMSLGK